MFILIVCSANFNLLFYCIYTFLHIFVVLFYGLYIYCDLKITILIVIVFKKMKEINDVDRRISAYIEFKGGDTVLAKKLGKKPQAYQAVRKFRIKAGREMIDALSTEPDFDLNYTFKGIRSLNVDYPAPIDSEVQIANLKARIKELEEESFKKSEIIEKIEEEKQTLFEVLRRK